MYNVWGGSYDKFFYICSLKYYKYDINSNTLSIKNCLSKDVISFYI